MQNELEITRAGFGPRAAAWIIDRLIVFAVLLIIRLPAALSAFSGRGSFSHIVFFRCSISDILCWALGAAYFVLLTQFTGSTLGKKVMHLRVISESGTDLRFIDVLYRETVGRFLSGILYLGYLMCLADKQHRAFHDWLCGTNVVYDDIRFRTKTAPTAADEMPAAGWSVPGSSRPAAAPAAPAAGYSIPGHTAPADSASPDLTLPFPAEEPLEKM